MTEFHDSISQATDILVVDDNIASLRLLTDILSKEGYQVRPADGPQVALESALAHPPSLILLDVRMPEMNGFEVCHRLKQDDRTRGIPVIFVSALDQVQDQIQGFEVGGVDFVSKPFRELEILARVKTHLQLRRTNLHLEELVAERTAELVQANEALRESEERYRTLVEQAQDGIVVLQDSRIQFANPAAVELFGYTPDELLNTGFTEYIFPDELAQTTDIHTRRMRGESVPHRYESAVLHKDGSRVEVEFNAGVTLYRGEPASLVMIRDITERKRAEEDLRRSKERLEEAQRTAQIGDWEYDILAGKMTWSDEMFRIRGVDPEQYVPTTKSDEEFCHPEDAPALRRAFERFFVAGEPLDLDYRIVTPQGTVKACRRRGRLIADDLGTPSLAIGTTEDITERWLVEQQVKEYQQRLKALVSLLTISEERERRRIACELHDEVGQTLAFARTGLASASKALSKVEREAILDDVSQSLRQAIRDTRDLIFDLSSPLMHELGLGAALAEWLEEQVGKKHGIRTEFIHDGRRFPLDDDMRAILFRSTRELLANVVKHAQARRVTVRLEGEGTLVRIVVQDDGIGFDTDAIPEATEREAGFGLFSIQERMADLNGSLEIQSERGQGCRATITAPVLTNQASRD